ncbi:MAG: 4'-phosphopantetheinyl transferase superfamily protein [Bacteroidetes bacterium]|nr:4'-phosphopantetheinyl transferase superfamily protein [Bacteroidota bacterium]
MNKTITSKKIYKQDKSNLKTLILYHQINKKWDEDKIVTSINKLPKFFKDDILKHKNKERKTASIIGKLLLTQGLKLVNKYAEKLKYKNEINSKPSLKNAPYFNISHCENIVVCAISQNYDIGIDIEKIKSIDIDNFTKLLSEQDLNFIRQSNNPSNSFFEIWTKKEAILKSSGTGITPTLFKNISFKENIGYLNNKERWYLQKLDIDDQYISYLSFPLDKELKDNKTIVFQDTIDIKSMDLIFNSCKN